MKLATVSAHSTTSSRIRPLPVLRSLGIVALFVLGLIAALATRGSARLETGPASQNPPIVWREAAWDLPLDNWGQGRVWRADTSDSGEIRLFARTKTGFCNCFSGIADDTEIDRIGDVDLHGDNFSPSALGVPHQLAIFRDGSGCSRPLASGEGRATFFPSSQRPTAKRWSRHWYPTTTSPPTWKPQRSPC